MGAHIGRAWCARWASVEASQEARFVEAKVGGRMDVGDGGKE